MIFLNTTLSSLSLKQIKRLTCEIFNYLKKTYKCPPSLKFCLSWAYKTKNYGEYDFCEHKIWLFYKNIQSVKMLMQVMLHELKHSQQNKYRYYALSTQHSYNNHPYEIAANKFASDQRIYNVWQHVAKNINYPQRVV